MAQVRLDEDVKAALQLLADETGGSIAQHANARLRQALGLPKTRGAVVRTIALGRGMTNASATAPQPRRRGPVR